MIIKFFISIKTKQKISFLPFYIILFTEYVYLFVSINISNVYLSIYLYKLLFFNENLENKIKFSLHLVKISLFNLNLSSLSLSLLTILNHIWFSNFNVIMSYYDSIIKQKQTKTKKIYKQFVFLLCRWKWFKVSK